MTYLPGELNDLRACGRKAVRERLRELELEMSAALEMTEAIQAELRELHSREKNSDEMIAHAAVIYRYAQLGSEALSKVETRATRMLEDAVKWRVPPSS